VNFYQNARFTYDATVISRMVQPMGAKKVSSTVKADVARSGDESRVGGQFWHFLDLVTRLAWKFRTRQANHVT